MVRQRESFSNILNAGGSSGCVQPGPVFACIDMGTNSFHMIVCRAGPERDRFDVITRVREPVPFLRRALAAHYIDDSAKRSALRILSDMVKKARDREADAVLAVATSAVRESNNGEQFLQTIRDELGLDAVMISGKEESRFIYLGVLWSMPELDGRFAITDIGGGSTEVIVADRDRMYFSESYKLGSARLTERFFAHGERTYAMLAGVHEEVQGVIRPAAVAIQASGGFNQLIGTSGTIQALAKMDRDSEAKPHVDLHGWRLPLRRAEAIVQHLEDKWVAGERFHEISVERAHTIVAGSIVLLELMRSLSVPDVLVCSAALREGVVIDRFLQTGWFDGRLAQHRDPRSASVHALLERYEGGFEHARHVALLSSQIFQQTGGRLHDYSKAIGHLLWSASMLHDVGMYIGRKGHHKHSYYLIRNAGLLGYSEEEIAIIAGIARYHRGSEPKESHEAYCALPPQARKTVADLSAMLRVAEALDRSRRQAIRSVKIAIAPLPGRGNERRQVLIDPVCRPGESCQAEKWALSEKKQFFEEQFQVRLDLPVEAREMYAQF